MKNHPKDTNILKNYLIYIVFICLGLPFRGYANSDQPHPISTLIQKLKQDIRGPYKDIRWFCDDGTVIEPKASCPGEGNQHARMKDEVSQLANRKHIFLSQILTGTDISDFYDEKNAHSRLIQYQLEQYLFDVDKGWINEKGQYYRGAKQVEDEMEWGRAFFYQILGNKSDLVNNYLLLRRAARDIPHGVDDDNTRSVRALSLIISDMFPKFQPIRIKIHGLPQESDINLVQAFKSNEKIPTDVESKIDELLDAMDALYALPDTVILRDYLKSIPLKNPLDQALKDYIELLKSDTDAKHLVESSADLMALIRTEITQIPKPRGRLDMLDLSNKLEDIILVEANKWEVKTIEEGLDKMCVLNTAIKGGGYIQEWEWIMLYETFPDFKISADNLDYYIDSYRRSIQWGTSMIYALYKEDVNTFMAFEPLASGFTDDIIRSTPLLSMGITLDKLHSFYAKEVKLNNQIFNLGQKSQAKGINPGYAKGILEVIESFEDNPYLDPSRIYIFNQPPKELKPLAGIATVTEGNVVSHVQLLARNLGIPNAAISLETLNYLKKHRGKEVFYAVSNKGSVVMKRTDDMTKEEKELFKEANTKKEKITIDLTKLELDKNNIINLRDIDAKASGKICGPKAANLAQLKNIFPNMVVDGLVIPFGIYREHMNQMIPDKKETYWSFINRVLYYLKDLESKNLSASRMDSIQNVMLDSLKDVIVNIDLLPDFEEALQDSFKQILGNRMGKVPVFLRSDTNMEDLKEFTGAGLNLTLFNVLDKNEIINGIKKVWASPFSERSYKWRQKYLENPENIYPSILIIPSVNVDKSGVLITKGIANDRENELTIAFSQGVGGAVDGQSAETYLVHSNKNITLMSPSRETIYKAIPSSGGTDVKSKSPGKITMSRDDLNTLINIAEEIKEIMPNYGMESPYDVELGLKDGKIWLFQIRPFVENKNAKSSNYLESISPKTSGGKLIDMQSELVEL